jgi:hypothetical protein
LEVRADGHRLNRGANALAQAEGDDLDGELARLDPGEVENVVEHHEQGIGRVLDRLEELALFGREVSIERELGHPHDARHGSADLVAHVRHELGLEPCGIERGLASLHEFRLDLLPLRDVLDRAHVAPDRTLEAVDRGDAGVHPSHQAPRRPHAQLTRELVLVSHHLEPVRHDRRVVVRMDGLDPTLAQALLAREPGDRLQATVRVDGAAPGVGLEDTDRGRGAERPEPFLAGAQFLRALPHLPLDELVAGFDLGPPPRHLTRRLQAPADGHEQEAVLERHPARVLEGPPRGRREHPEDRLGPKDPPEEMIERDDHRPCDEDLPVAVEGEEGQRAEHVEVGLDAPAGEVDEQGRREHLPSRDNVTRQCATWAQHHEQDGERRDDATDDYRGVDVDVRLTIRARPRPGRNPERGGDGRHPLAHHQRGEEAVGAVSQRRLLLRIELGRTLIHATASRRLCDQLRGQA